MHVVIDKIVYCKTSEKAKKPGLEYCRLNVSDNSANLQLVCWPEMYNKIRDDLAEGTVACIEGKKDDWQGRSQIVVYNLKILG
jgi:DNA polymerase III alpha subunit